MATVLLPIPSTDFDPTETAVLWRLLTHTGHSVVFATPDGLAGAADVRMLTGLGLGLLAPILRADANGLVAYTSMAQSLGFKKPLRWDQLQNQNFDAILLAGGHAPGMKPYLESTKLQAVVADFFTDEKPVGAICHGVVLAARSNQANGKSVLHGKRSTALTQLQEMTAWSLTCTWLGNYYRTYPESVAQEVKRALGDAALFNPGPLAIKRDSDAHLERGFTVRDGNYLSARWPGDAHRFGREFCELLS
jgi:protease I